MNLKRVLLTIVCLVIVVSSYAQDKIYKKNGDIIEGKVTAVNVKAISYKRADNPSGPEYTVYKKDVDKIVYENGTQDEFDNEEDDVDNRRMPPRPPFRNHKLTASEARYGNNIIALSPMQLTNDNIQGGVGLSLSYERMLDKNGIVSFYMPAIVSFSSDNSYYGNTYNNTTHTSMYFMPGVKFYPTGSRGVVRYAVGPSFVVAFGNTGNGTDPYGNPVSGNYNIFGFIVNNSLNIYPTPHLYLGLELGLGVSYVTNMDNSYNTNVGFGADPMVQFAFKVGYRF